MFDTTIVDNRTENLDALKSIFGTGSMDVLTPQEPESNVLKDSNSVVTDILDGAAKANVVPKEEEPVTVVPKVAIDNKAGQAVLNEVLSTLEPKDEETEGVIVDNEKGRPKLEKNSLVSYLAQKIEANEFGIPEDAPYDAKKQTLPEYLGSLSEKELHTYLDANIKSQIEDIRTSTPKEFFESLPEELQYAAAYVAEGGTDMKGIFRALSHVEEVKALDPAVESDQIAIARSYLQATRFGTADQINEQIEDWKTADKIEKKAREFKPALDDMQKEQVAAYQRQAAEQNKQQQELQKFYTTNVYKALENNELAGIKFDKKFARELADNMVSTAPGPWDGKPVNYLGYGLQKSQFIEPDYEAVMLAAMILNDKAGTLEKIRQQGANVQVEKDKKLIKMNQGAGLGTTTQPTPEVKQVRRINTKNVLTSIKM